MRIIGQEVKKVDADILLGAKPAYTGDLVPKDALIIKVLRSPYPHAIIEDINTIAAEKTEGVVCVLTYKNCPYFPYTNAGQAYPQQTPYDRHILDKKVRYVGDEVAIVAAETEAIATAALKRIRVKYRKLPPVLDYETAEHNPSVIHDQSDYIMKQEAVIHNDRFHNVLSQGSKERGDWDKTWEECAYTVEETYHTQAASQCMMETFISMAEMDYPEHLKITTSTQIPFHIRHIIARALGIAPNKINVVKPKVGGGFGAKQTSVSEVFPAAVTWLTGRSSVYTYTRGETFCSSSRHAMRMDVKIGCDKDGHYLAASCETLSNAGAYGEHGTTTVRLSYQRPLIMCNHAKAIRMADKVVYTNMVPGAAFRGFGNTQGAFAVECAINQLAIKAGIDPLEFRLRNMIQTGEVLFTYYNQTLTSCTLKECLLRGAEMIGWDGKNLRQDMGNGVYRAKGMAVCAQGTAMSKLVTGSVILKLNEFGFYTLLQGSGEMGQGCETVFAQVAAEVLRCPVDKIHVRGVETDTAPFDTGSYSSSSTYMTGHASRLAAEELRSKIIGAAAKLLERQTSELEFDGEKVFCKEDESSFITLDTIAASHANELPELIGHGTFVPETAPTPFMAGFTEVEVNTKTGRVTPIRTVGVIDSGTCINKALCRVQGEGGMAQGIGMALYENVLYGWNGKMVADSFLQYKIPARPDVGKIEIDFCESYEPSGPFGAKSIGEVVVNTASPAIAHAIYNACGVWVRDLPMTPEKVLMAIREKNRNEQYI